MKSLSKFYTVILCISLALTISIGQLVYCAHSTLMSPGYFANTLEDDKKLSQLTALTYSSLSQSTNSQYTLKVLNGTDQAWVKSQIYLIAKGLQQYIISEASTLPTLDIRPLNDTIREFLLSEAMKQPNTEEKVNNVKTVLTVLNNKYFSAIINFGLNNQLAAMLLELAPIRGTGFDRTTILEIIRIYLSFSNKSTSLDQASQNIVEHMAAEFLELEKLKDYFDLNLFVQKTFKNNNPIANLRAAVTSVDKAVTRIIYTLFWSLLLLIWINLRFSVKKLLRLTFACTGTASIISLLLSAVAINPISSAKLAGTFIASKGALGTFLIKLWVLLSRDLGLYLALQAVLTGIIAFILFLIFKFTFNKPTPAKARLHALPKWRFTFVILAFVLIFTWWNVSVISMEINNYNRSIDELHQSDINQSVVRGLIEAGGMEFLKHVKKSEKAVLTVQ